ncbi:hypothetical protein FA13DRAFT_1740809, partial [Coprinellus micaceus]
MSTYRYLVLQERVARRRIASSFRTPTLHLEQVVFHHCAGRETRQYKSPAEVLGSKNVPSSRKIWAP